MTLPDRITGDGPCGDCGTENNIIWFTDNVVWNAVMRPDGEPEGGDPFLCVTCFVRRTDEAGYRPTGWHLIPDWHWETKVERIRRLYPGRT